MRKIPLSEVSRVRKDETIEGKVRELGQANRSVRAKRERMIKMSSR